MPLKPDSKTGLRRQIVQLEKQLDLANKTNDLRDEVIDRLESDLSGAQFTIKWLRTEKQTLLGMIKSLTGMVK